MTKSQDISPIENLFGLVSIFYRPNLYCPFIHTWLWISCFPLNTWLRRRVGSILERGVEVRCAWWGVGLGGNQLLEATWGEGEEEEGKVPKATLTCPFWELASFLKVNLYITFCPWAVLRLGNSITLSCEFVSFVFVTATFVFLRMVLSQFQKFQRGPPQSLEIVSGYIGPLLP